MKKLSALIATAVLTLSAALSVSAAEPTASVPVSDGNVYKNLFSLSQDAAEEDTAAIPAELEKLSGAVDSRSTAYLSFAVYGNGLCRGKGGKHGCNGISRHRVFAHSLKGTEPYNLLRRHRRSKGSRN